jgi:hypothetical protein
MTTPAARTLPLDAVSTWIAGLAALAFLGIGLRAVLAPAGLVVSAAFIVLGGQAADRFGARVVSMGGLALFGVASCIIASR